MATESELKSLMDIIASGMPGGSEAYLVGGTVRDMYMGREPTDVDLAVTCDPGILARDIARTLGGSAFALDEGRGVYRVAAGHGQVEQVDISPLKGGITADLAARDFTINAMALPVACTGSHCPPAGEVIDPYAGMDDITDRVVRVIGERSIIDDPLRLLRAFRLSAQLGFRVERYTLELIERDAALIGDVSPERVRDELYMTLACGGAGETLTMMLEYGLLFRVLPELEPMLGMEQGGPHVHDLLKHSIRAASYAEEVMADTARWFGDSSARLDDFLQEKVDGTADMLTLVKLCALMHDTGKPSTLKLVDGVPRFFGHDEEGSRITSGLAERLRMSERARRTLSVTAGMHMRPLNVSREAPTMRAIYRMVRDAGDALPALAVVALADALATREQADAAVTYVEGLVRRLLDYYYGEHEAEVANPLVTGDDIMKAFGLEPGPVIGAILADVAEKRAEGRLGDREAALRFVGENLGRYTGER